MDRRQALRRTAALMGGVVFLPSFAGVLNGCTAQPGLDWRPEYFAEDQARLITRLTDVIIPETDTPGAAEAGVPAFIEEMVYTAYEVEERQLFETGLARFDERVQEEYDASYIDLDEEQQLSFAEELNREAIEGDTDEDPAFFLVMKELTLAGYFTSEIGATQTLRHERVPGRYDGCVPFEDVGKAWAV